MKPVEGLELELALLGRSILAGIVFSAIYDGIRVIRRIFPHGIIWTSFEDLLYWLVAGSWLFLKVCQVNNGIIRGYMILGIGAGALLYHALCGKRIMRYLTKWIVWLKKQLKRWIKAVTIRVKKLHRNQETENEEKNKKTP